MGLSGDVADITAEHAGDRLRYFAGVDPEPSEVTVHHLREDVHWTDHREREVKEELLEVTAKESYEHTTGVDSVNQVIGVADTRGLFTGCIDEQVAVTSFERGSFTRLSPVVARFRDCLLEHDIGFGSLAL